METDVANDDGDESAAVLDEGRIGALEIAERDERAQRSDRKRAERPDAAGGEVSARGPGHAQERDRERGHVLVHQAVIDQGRDAAVFEEAPSVLGGRDVRLAVERNLDAAKSNGRQIESRFV